MPKEALYPHVPKNKEPLFPHRPPGSTIPEPLAREFRRELRKLPAWKLQEAFDKLRMGEPTTGIDILDKHRAEALNAVKEALWERRKLSEYVKLSIPFFGAGAGELQWETVLEEKIIMVTVTNIVGVKQYDLEIDFRDSTARISNLVVGRSLPFKATSKGKLWWFATINDIPVEVEVSGIRLLTQIQLEDAFANSIARIEEVSISSLAQTEGNPVSKYCCRRCGDCAPEELLGEGKFPERISWLRRHYQGKHPGIWGG